MPIRAANFIFAAALLGLAACSPGRTIGAIRAPVPVERDFAARARIVPLVDHHQHVFGEALIDPPTELLPEVALPSTLRDLLRRRQQISGTTNLRGLYADDARVLNVFWDTDHWVQGEPAISEVVNEHGAGLRFVANAYAVQGGVAFISGIAFADSEGEYDKHFALGLKRDRGAWLIASESITAKVRNPFRTPVDAKTLVMRLDDAGIERAAVLSTAFWLARRLSSKPVAEQASRTREANDWVIAQAALFPDRLVPFCSVSPLAPFAMDELDRCSAVPDVRGFKLHFANNRIDLKRADDLQKVQAFFRAADAKRFAIVVHLWPTGGAEYSRIFLEQVLPHAPNIPVQIAHVGSGDGKDWDDVLAVFAEAISINDPRASNLYLDVADFVREDTPEEVVLRLTQLIRQTGTARILYGSDTPIPGQRPMPVQQWATFKRRLPLTNQELMDIADNIAPYMRPDAR